MSRWLLRPLGDICSTTSGGTPSRTHSEYFGGAIPWIKSGDLTDGEVVNCDETITDEALRNSSAKLLKQGSVLIAMYGATVGKLGMLGREAATNQAVCGISTPSELDRWFLFYFLLSQRQKLIEQSTGGAQPNINQKIVRELLVPIPPLPEQRRIVDLLSRAEGIVRLRREAEKKAAGLVQGIFLEMFGDPATNPKGWPISRIADFSTLITSGSTPRGGSDVYVNQGPYFIRSQNVLMNRLDLSEAAHITPEIHSQMARTSVAVGDVLLNITGASIGRVAWVESLNGDANVNQHVCIIRLNPNLCHPTYLSVCLSMPYYQMLINTVQAGASRQALNHAQVRSLPVLKPPQQLQKQFADRMRMVMSIQTQQASATSRAQAVFGTLLGRVFHTVGSS